MIYEERCRSLLRTRLIGRLAQKTQTYSNISMSRLDLIKDIIRYSFANGRLEEIRYGLFVHVERYSM